MYKQYSLRTMNIPLNEQPICQPETLEADVSVMRRDCSLSFNGESWDVSNLSLNPPRRAISLQHPRRTPKNLYPSVPVSPSRKETMVSSSSTTTSIVSPGVPYHQLKQPPPSCSQVGATWEQSPQHIKKLTDSRRRYSIEPRPDLRDEFRVSRRPELNRSFYRRQGLQQVGGGDSSSSTINHSLPRQDSWRSVQSTPAPPMRPLVRKSSPPPQPSNNYNDYTTPKPTTFSRMEVEISPGNYMPMIGAAETTHAIRDGRVRSTTCFGCDSQLYCVMTSACVICPACKTVSPVSFEQQGLSVEGVGLGVSAQDYQTALLRF